MDGKYVAFKTEAWEKFREELGRDADEFEQEHKLEDAVVLRGQDVFTPGALFAYSNNVVTTVEILRGVVEPSVELEEELQTLMGIADTFHALGIASAESQSKLPD